MLKVIVDFGTMLIFAAGARLLREKLVKGNQQASLTELIFKVYVGLGYLWGTICVNFEFTAGLNEFIAG